MRNALAVLAFACALTALAKPIVCSIDDYDLAFASASYNTRPAPLDVDGGFTTDAGTRLQTTALGQLAAPPDAGETCAGEAKRLTVRFVDPWTGETVTLSLGGTP